MSYIARKITVDGGLKHNWGATSAPTVNDDSTKEYYVGSQWVNVSTNQWYICTDNTSGAAVWVTTASGGTSSYLVSVDTSGFTGFLAGTTPATVQGMFDKVDTITNPLLFKGAIAVAADFPTSADVQVGWLYRVTANVTDNDATKTNTGQSFLAGDEIAWNGTNWSSLGSTAIWIDDGTDIKAVTSTRNLDMQDSDIKNVGTQSFDITNTTQPAEGEVNWDSDTGTIQVGLPGGVVKLQIGEENVLKVKAGEDIDNGEVVYVSGADGTNIIVNLADNSTYTTSQVVGMATEDISNGSNGYITTFGVVHNLNTDSYTAGDLLWLGTGGAVQITRPEAPNETVFIGVVTRKNISEGEIAVNPIIIPRLIALSDVYSPSRSESDILAWDATNLRWESGPDVLASFFNGTFREAFDCVVTSDGATITATLEKKGGGDLTMQFSDGVTTLDCTPADSVTLTAGTIASPQENYVYVLQSTKALTASTTGWPATEHIRVAFFLVQTAAYVQSDGALVTQNYNDVLNGSNGQGHMSHMGWRERLDGAKYVSGVDPAGTSDYITLGSGTAYWKSSSGVVWQMHEQTYTAKDTSASDDIHVVNASATDGGAYTSITNLYNITEDSTGSTLTNKYYNLVFWGSQNKSGEYSPVFCNVSSGSYNLESKATQDVDGHDIYTIPSAFMNTGFLICRITLKNTAGVLTVIDTKDLRGTIPTTVSGSTGYNQTSFSDSVFSIYNNADSTKIAEFDASNITTATTRTYDFSDFNGTLGSWIVDGTYLVQYSPLAYNIGTGSSDPSDYSLRWHIIYSKVASATYAAWGIAGIESNSDAYFNFVNDGGDEQGLEWTKPTVQALARISYDFGSDTMYFRVNSINSCITIDSTGATNMRHHKRTIQTITSTDTLVVTDDITLCNSSSGITVNLPTASGITGKYFTIKNINTGTVTVDPNGSETIDGSATYAISVQYDAVTLISDGTNWQII